ncbi:MAG: hypothetical protein OEZ34_17225, partial [Spirochaetia bacterium]|nr:hypothetical protein [Spirochaetia bacterium]
AVKEIFQEYFPLNKYESTLQEIAKQVFSASQVEISDGMPAENYKELLKSIPALFDLISDRKWDKDSRTLASGIEFILEGLTVTQKLSRRKLGDIISFKSVDVY